MKCNLRPMGFWMIATIFLKGFCKFKICQQNINPELFVLFVCSEVTHYPRHEQCSVQINRFLTWKHKQFCPWFKEDENNSTSFLVNSNTPHPWTQCFIAVSFAQILEGNGERRCREEDEEFDESLGCFFDCPILIFSSKPIYIDFQLLKNQAFCSTSNF